MTINLNTLPKVLLNMVGHDLDDKECHALVQVNKNIHTIQQDLMGRRQTLAFKKMEELCQRIDLIFSSSIFGAPDQIVIALKKNSQNQSPPVKIKHYKLITAYLCYRRLYKNSAPDYFNGVQTVLFSNRSIDDKIVILSNTINQEFCNENILGKAITAFTSIRNRQTGMYTEDSSVCKILIKLGIDPNGKPQGKETGSALHICLEFDRPKTLAFLIQNGAKPDLVDAYGVPPLHHVVNMGNTASLEHFIKYHPNPFILNQFKQTPKESAKAGNDASQVAILEQYEKEFRGHMFTHMSEGIGLPAKLIQLSIDYAT